MVNWWRSAPMQLLKLQHYVYEFDNAKQSFRKISLSQRTTDHHTEQLSNNIHLRWMNPLIWLTLLNYQFSFVELTRNWLSQKIFLCLCIINEIDYFIGSMKGTTTGSDVYRWVTSAIEKKNFGVAKPTAILTEVAPAMNCVQNGFTRLLLDEKKGQDITPLHCIVHQQNLAAITLKIDNVLQGVKDT